MTIADFVVVANTNFTAWINKTNEIISGVNDNSDEIVNMANTVSFLSSANNVLTVIKTVDGATSGLDADLLDGQHGSFYSNASNMSTGTLPAARFTDSTHGNRAGGSLHASANTSVAGFMSSADKTKLNGIESGATADQTAAEILIAIKTVDGAASGLDADLLDGQEGSFYQNAANLNAGVIPNARLTGAFTAFTNISGSGTASFLVFGAGAGSEGSPSHTFTGDLNTGIYNPAGDQVGIATNGVGRFFVSTTGVTSNLPINGTSGVFSGTLTSQGSQVATYGNAGTFTAPQRNALSVLTDAATITPNFNSSNKFHVTLGASRIMGNPTGGVQGQSIVIFVYNPSTYTLSYGSAWKFPGGIVPPLTAGWNVICAEFLDATWISANVVSA